MNPSAGWLIAIWGGGYPDDDLAPEAFGGLDDLRDVVDEGGALGVDVTACESSVWADFSPLSSCRVEQAALKVPF